MVDLQKINYMAFLPVLKYYILNGELKPVSEFIYAENNGGIYEVIRVEKGIPLFIKEHLFRFYQSLQIAEKEALYSNMEIVAFIKKLIAGNNTEQGNILISCKKVLKIFFVAHNYPSEKMVKEGVKCGILYAERENPNAKVLQTTVRQKADKLISENNFYEAVLADKSGNITEGSRSNIFFVKGNRIITPPGKSVLLGITRKKVIELIHQFGFYFSEQVINSDELPNFDAAFLTGTSPKILPVKQIETVLFDPRNPVIQRLITGYNSVIAEYIKHCLPN